MNGIIVGEATPVLDQLVYRYDNDNLIQVSSWLFDEINGNYSYIWLNLFITF